MSKQLLKEIQSSNNLRNRLFYRVDIILPVRILFQNNKEITANITNCSPNDCYVNGRFNAGLGDKVIIYIDVIGRVEGNISRLDDNGMAVTFNISDIRRQKIADKLTLALNQSILDANTKRFHQRKRVNKQNQIIRANGVAQNCVLIDVSLGGASITSNPLPFYGEEISLNNIPARVVHVTEKSVGVMFLVQSDSAKQNAFAKYFR